MTRALIVCVALAMALVACVKDRNVPCVNEKSCDLAAGGTCVATDTGQWCAYPDESCEGSGLRFSDYDVSANVKVICVPPATSSVGDADAAVDGTPDAVPTCTTSEACTATTPVCDTAKGVCAACSMAGDCSRYRDTPLCGDKGACVECRGPADCAATTGQCDVATGQCKGCDSDGECATRICDTFAHVCALPGDILYVDTRGNDGVQCTKDAPCLTIAGAFARVQGTRKHVVLGPGTFNGAPLADKDFTLHGNGASISSSLEARGNVSRFVALRSAAAIVVDNGQSAIELVAVSTANFGIGIVNSHVSISASNISNNINDGIKALGSSVVTIDSCDISSNGTGVFSKASSLSIRRSQITRSTGDGIYAFAGTVEIINNTVSDNHFNGLFIDRASNARVEHNTIANNQAIGLLCQGTSATRNNVLWNNTGGAIGGQCGVNYSVVGPGPLPPGIGNLGDDPLLSAAYRIPATSPARDRADPVRQPSGGGMPVSDDIDGQERPFGGRADIGADEYVP